jgi:hypothetical protein
MHCRAITFHPSAGRVLGLVAFTVNIDDMMSIHFLRTDRHQFYSGLKKYPQLSDDPTPVHHRSAARPAALSVVSK